MKRLTLLSCSLVFGLLAACGSDGDNNGDCAVEANYASIHDNLLSTQTCARAGCHADANAANNNLSFAAGADATYSALVGAAVVEPMATQSERVVAGDANASFLHVVLVDPSNPAGLMPLGGVAIPSCQSDAVAEWINAGAAR